MNALTRLLLPSVVLYFHGVVPKYTDQRVQTLHFESDRFASLLRDFKRHYVFASLDDLKGAVEKSATFAKPVAFLTSDDGYVDNLTVALPILQDLQIPLATFISTEHISTGARFPTHIMRQFFFYAPKGEYPLPHIDAKVTVDHADASVHWSGVVSRTIKSCQLSQVRDIVGAMRAALGEKLSAELNQMFVSDMPMNWGEVERLRSAGVIIGAHGAYHTNLHAREQEQVIVEQITESCGEIQRRMGSCDYFAFPTGNKAAIGAPALRYLKTTAVKFAFSTQEGTIRGSVDPYLMPRVHLSPAGRRNVARTMLSWRSDAKLRDWQKAMVSDASVVDLAQRRTDPVAQDRYAA